MVNFKNFVLGIGIIIVFSLVLYNGVETFYKSPDWNGYCGNVVVPQTLDSQGNFVEASKEQCELSEGAEWVNYDSQRFPGVINGQKRLEGYCNYRATCQKNYENAKDKHSWSLFLISIIVGIMAIILGYSILSIEPVGSALIGSGIWSFFYGSVVNWRNFGEIWRFLILLAVLIILIWIAIALNRKKKSKFKKFFRGFGFK